jgi:hypothetical protein
MVRFSIRGLYVVLHLHDRLGRDDDVAHGALLVERDDAVLEVVLDLVLVTRVSVHDVPTKHSEAPELRYELTASVRG